MKPIQNHSDLLKYKPNSTYDYLSPNYTPTSSKHLLRQTYDPHGQFNILQKVRKNSGNHLDQAKYQSYLEPPSPQLDSRKKAYSTHEMLNEGSHQIAYVPSSPLRSLKQIEDLPVMSYSRKQNTYTEYKTDFKLKSPYTIPRSKSKNNSFQVSTAYERKLDTSKMDEPVRPSSNLLQIPKTHNDQLRTTIDRAVSPNSAKYLSNKFEQSKVAKDYCFNSSMVTTKDNTPKQSSPFVSSKFSPSAKAPQSPLSLSNFNVGKRLGEGKFGEVFKALHKDTKTLFALKRVKKSVIKSHMMQDQFMMEIKMQLFFNHPNILKLYAVFDDIQYIYLLLEFMEEGTLYSKLKKAGKLSEEDASQLMSDVLKGVTYLHNNGIAHRDIKPQNIVISNGVCKLCDFGWAAICNDDRRSTLCGTLDYSAPQILQGKQYGRSIDLWCLGVLAFELLVGKAPFYHISRKETMKKIMNAQHQQFILPSNLSEKARCFIGQLILWDPEERMGAKQALTQPFIKDYANSQL